MIRPIRKTDNPQIARVIRTVLTEFGANREGFAFGDPSLDQMYETYSTPGSFYHVVEKSGQVKGGGGIAPLAGGQADTCELQKMYTLPEVRGKGLGRALLDRLLAEAKKAGYGGCYLETYGPLVDAHRLFEKAGFKRLKCRMGNTGHFACEIWYYKDLN